MPKHVSSQQPEVRHVAVESSNIETVGYHPQTKDLHVTFKSGGHYVYHKVSEPLYDRFLKSESKGKFFHAHIKGKHQFTKLP